MITLVDIGIGNIRSVQKALEQVGARVALSADAAELRQATRIVLPGVGAFGAGMDRLRKKGLVGPLREAAAAGIPLLGICLGMQLLFEESEEMGHHQGLCLLPGRVVRFMGDDLKVPHIGWNRLQYDEENALLRGVARGAYAYFVHSYYCRPDTQTDIIAQTIYGKPFAAIAGRDHIYGVQFHPEKSQQVGLQILRNFVTMEVS